MKRYYYIDFVFSNYDYDLLVKAKISLYMKLYISVTY